MAHFLHLHRSSSSIKTKDATQKTHTNTDTEMGSLPHLVEDIHGVLQVFSDGSIVRAADINFNIPIHDDGSVVWKDCLFDEENNLHLRLYKPASASDPSTKLLVVYFMHGGGFCVGSCTWPNNHNGCLRLASGLEAIVVAPDHRLAPEHRLPAAMNDALSSLKWLQSQALSDSPDSWLHDHEVDFDRVFIVGDSSGGNMAHHLAVQLSPGSPELAPVRVRGYVLLAPFFGGTVRTKSEAEGEPEPLLNLEILDRFWRLSLPVGKDRDHSLANPFGPFSRNLKPVTLDPILVIAGSRELLRDRVENYARRLKELGKEVFYVEFKEQQHDFFINDPYSDLGNRVLQEIKDFMSKSIWLIKEVS